MDLLERNGFSFNEAAREYSTTRCADTHAICSRMSTTGPFFLRRKHWQVTALLNIEDIHPSIHNGVFHANPICHHCGLKRKAGQGHLVRTQTGGRVCICPVCTAGVQVRAACKMITYISLLLWYVCFLAILKHRCVNWMMYLCNS